MQESKCVDKEAVGMQGGGDMSYVQECYVCAHA